MTKKILASEIKEGMNIYVQGHLMEVKNVIHVIYQEGVNEGATGTYFKGVCVSADDDIYKTCYNGGSYGSIDTHSWMIEV